MNDAIPDANPRRRDGIYVAPSFVPNWGWPELFFSARCLLSGRIVRGPYPERYAEAVRAELGVRFSLPVNRAPLRHPTGAAGQRRRRRG